MSPEAQRIAIAEACGWKYCLDNDGDVVGFPTDAYHWQNLPNYPEDLNAMHEAEKALNTPLLWDAYKGWLLMFVTEPVCATAAQRAESFLRTIGKWDGGAE